MRTLIATLLVAGCSPAPGPGNPQTSPRAAARSEKLTADTPLATTAGDSFSAPAGWTIAMRQQNR